MADKIFDLIGSERRRISIHQNFLCSYLEKEGFEVERGTGFATAFQC
ncbi:MAG: hypothetical protein ACLUZ6_05805 [Lachnospira eligens]